MNDLHNSSYSSSHSWYWLHLVVELLPNILGQNEGTCAELAHATVMTSVGLVVLQNKVTGTVWTDIDDSRVYSTLDLGDFEHTFSAYQRREGSDGDIFKKDKVRGRCVLLPPPPPPPWRCRQSVALSSARSGFDPRFRFQRRSQHAAGASLWSQPNRENSSAPE